MRLTAMNDAQREGMGRITAISGGDTYTVEVLSGTLQLHDTVSIFREADEMSVPRVGRSTVTRVDPVAVTSEGAVLSIVAEEGMEVKRGDLLFEMATGTLDEMQPASADIVAPVEGIVASVSASPGQSVSRDQAVVSLYRIEQLQLVSSVSEVDAQLVRVGGTMRIVFDSIPGQSFMGTIRAISGMGAVSDNYTEYDVYIDFTPDDQVRLGMSGTAYPED